MFIISNTYKKDIPQGYKFNSRKVQRALALRARKFKLENLSEEFTIYAQELLGGK